MSGRSLTSEFLHPGRSEMRTCLLQSCRGRGGEGGMQRTQYSSVTQWGRGGGGSPHHPDRQEKEHSEASILLPEPPARPRGEQQSHCSIVGMPHCRDWVGWMGVPDTIRCCLAAHQQTQQTRPPGPLGLFPIKAAPGGPNWV